MTDYTADRAAEQRSPVITMAASLRELADWLDQNADCGPLQHACQLRGDHDWSLNVYCIDRDELAAIARALGRADKGVDGGYFKVARQFGAAGQVYGYTSREKVCRRVVKGTRTVTREIPDPDAAKAVPTVTVTETVEDVEWICEPSLLAEPEPEEVA